MARPTHSLIIATLTAIAMATHTDVLAQTDTITGQIYDITGSTETYKKPLDIRNIDLYVFGYNDKAKAEHILHKYKETPQEDLMIFGFTFEADTTLATDKSGCFKIGIAPTGALLVQYGMSDIHFIPIDGRKHIEYGIDAGHRLDEVTVKGRFRGIGKIDRAPESTSSTIE